MVDVTADRQPVPDQGTDAWGRLIRAAVIGTGFVGPFHVDAIRRGGYGDGVAAEFEA